MARTGIFEHHSITSSRCGNMIRNQKIRLGFGKLASIRHIKQCRREAFQMYNTCSKGEQVYFDVVSLYPTFIPLDEYAFGFRKHVKASVAYIRQNHFIGLVKREVIPTKSIKIPVLPDNDNGKPLFMITKWSGHGRHSKCARLRTCGIRQHIFATMSYTSVKWSMQYYVMHL